MSTGSIIYFDNGNHQNLIPPEEDPSTLCKGTEGSTHAHPYPPDFLQQALSMSSTCCGAVLSYSEGPQSGRTVKNRAVKKVSKEGFYFSPLEIAFKFEKTTFLSKIVFAARSLDVRVEAWTDLDKEFLLFDQKWSWRDRLYHPCKGLNAQMAANQDWFVLFMRWKNSERSYDTNSYLMVCERALPFRVTMLWREMPSEKPWEGFKIALKDNIFSLFMENHTSEADLSEAIGTRLGHFQWAYRRREEDPDYSIPTVPVPEEVVTSTSSQSNEAAIASPPPNPAVDPALAPLAQDAPPPGIVSAPNPAPKKKKRFSSAFTFGL